MKNILIVLGIFISTIAFAQDNKATAFYNGFDKENNVFVFEDADGSSIEFSEVKADVLKKFDLKSTKLNGQAFIITYIIKEIEEDGDVYEENTITNLVETKLEKNKESYEDEDEE